MLAPFVLGGVLSSDSNIIVFLIVKSSALHITLIAIGYIQSFAFLIGTTVTPDFKYSYMSDEFFMEHCL